MSLNMSFQHALRGMVAPIATASISTLSLLTLSQNSNNELYNNNKIQCDDGINTKNVKQQDILNIPEVLHNIEKTESHEPQNRKAGFLGGDGTQYFDNLFPLRQLFQPSKPYPLWDDDWDGKQEERWAMSSKELRKNGKTRHVILIRHGQYEEADPEDEKKVLTPLGREQSRLTGIRIAEMIKGINDTFGPCHVKAIHVSNLTRAKETADIIAQQLPQENVIERTAPDPLLNEGRPCHHIPTGKVTPSIIKKTDEQHERIEQGFQKYIFTAPPPSSPSSEGEQEEPKHEFEIIVCHGNVIRYFFCRALQLPPEAWLRLCTFNCSLTYFTIRPSGSVSCRMLGDVGHLGYENSTFSMHHGFNW